MMYLAKVKVNRMVNGTMKKVVEKYLIQDDVLVGAAYNVTKQVVSDDNEPAELIYIAEVAIKEEGNPAYKKEHEDAPSWTVTLETEYLDETTAKEKKLRYKILLWSEETPSMNGGELMYYLQGLIDEFRAVKIQEANIIAVL